MKWSNEAELESIRAQMEQRTVTLPDGTILPAIGQGTWHMGENPAQFEQEVQALQLGLEVGMRVVDTAEMYGNGAAEQVVGEAIKGRRENAFLVSKVFPHNAGLTNIKRACENSLQRLGIEQLDMYLLHWRGGVPLEETVEGMEQLKQEGKIARWGVSNLDLSDMKELQEADKADECMTNQVLYHLGSRGIEYDLLPWQQTQDMPIMAYCPLAQAGRLRKKLVNSAEVQAIADTYQVSSYQVLLAWVLRKRQILAIPKASQADHVLQNAKTASLQLDAEDIKRLDEAFPPPSSKQPLDIV
ncbi:aldo/keto reductase [Salsuginibacillus kocurii]|uniref:aldo/keto reductase n=1 Tax=Salsuginibacillus kocurii TaxID=427078 RepID=UPI00037616E7|nr:aldo/keto reductase [Salsuginibacillus kocurii]